MARRCSGVENASLSGLRDKPPDSLSRSKFGVSEIARRMYQPMIPIGMAMRNGMRHAHDASPPPLIASALSHGDMANAIIVPVSSARNDAICA